MYVCGVALGVGYVYMLGMHVFGESVLYVYVYLVWECVLALGLGVGWNVGCACVCWV